jgi:ADP-heptose:LPS heptosyltransferase
MIFDIAQIPASGIVSEEPLKIYTGMLGQIGDIIIFTPTVRRLRQLFPRSQITFAVSAKYREAGELVAGLPYIDRLFVTELFCEKLLTPRAYDLWHQGWPVELRGEDEIAEQQRHDLIFETRLRNRRCPWWQYNHMVAEVAYQAGVPGPIDLRTEICIPPGTTIPTGAEGKIVFHNDPAIDSRKAWPWEHAARFIEQIGPEEVVLLGNPGPVVPGTLDLRGQTTLGQAAAIICASQCYVGIDSGLMWIAGSLQVPAVGLYGTSYIPAYSNIQPVNPRALYLQAEGPVAAIPPDAVVERCRRLAHTVTSRATDRHGVVVPSGN